MPQYEVTSPDGKTYTVNAPDGASQDDAIQYVQKNFYKSSGAANSIANDKISEGARNFASEGSDALGGLSQHALNLLAGGIRGAGSIGATLAYPFEGKPQNEERRLRMDENARAMGAQPESWMYKGGKLGGEIAGTSGAGGLLAKPMQAISNLSLLAGAGAIPALDTAAAVLASGGMRANGAGLVSRAAGGAVSGGASVGLADPESAGSGALIGGAFPVMSSLVSKGSKALGNSMRGNGANPTTMETARESIESGYVIPPNMVNPSLKNQVIESISGKQATQQIASMKNSEVTEGLVRSALGIAEDIPITQSTLEKLRKTAGKTYAEVSNLSPEAASDLEALKLARNEANGWFKAYNRSASPLDLAKAKDFRATAEQLEGALEGYAKEAGRPELIFGLRSARKEIAKTYTVGRALNDASGTVDARVLGRMYEKDAPLSDGLDTVGRFASAFPSIAKSPQQVGSPAAHNLKALASMALSLGGNASLGPMGLLTGALPFIAPSLARASMFSNGAQRGLLQFGKEIADDSGGLLTQAAYRGAPLMFGQ